MKLSDFNLLEDDTEKTELLTRLESYNQTDRVFSDNITLHALFKQQAEKTPNALVLHDFGTTLNYRELDQRSNQLARFLIANGVLVEQPVAVMLQPSSQWLIAMLAILKAGACYLPIDQRMPNTRIKFILNNTNTRFLISESSKAKQLNLLAISYQQLNTVIALDSADASLGFANYHADNFSTDPIDEFISSENLAYIIYTSGSSGQPKGVMIEHRSCINMVNWHQRSFQVTANSRATLFASIGFDASIWETFPYLLSGACLYPLNDDLRLDAEQLVDFLQQQVISHIFVPPLMCQQICQIQRGRLNHNINIFSGGDTLKKLTTNGLTVINNYGPTECTVLASSILVNTNVIPTIGKPIDNTRIYITDNQRQLVPTGVPGEICIAGIGLARGYWQDSELSLKKFIDNPFDPGQRLYCSGDLGRWQQNGELEFLGRLDEQIKIRGFRIEPGEIECALLSYAEVQSAVVISRELSNANPVLLAYVIVSEVVDYDALLIYLKERLPEYMLPAHIIPLPALPVTVNGKIDKSALPSPSISHNAASRLFITPTNETEHALQTIWQDLLDVTPISIDDNFFELGGHSMKVTSLAASIRDQLEVDLPLAALFKAPTIRQLAELILDHTKFNIEHADTPLLLLNGVTDAPKLFAFPPVTGDAIGFSQFSSYFKHYSFYSFNFIESNKLIKDYADLVIATEPNGPYRLLGYSAGGNLAYHVAYELEQRNKKVLDIIMIDSARLMESLSFPKHIVQETIDQFIRHESMQAYLHNAVLRDKSARIIRRYYHYIAKTLDTHRVNANIHVLTGEDEEDFYYSDNAEIKPLLTQKPGSKKRTIMSVSDWKSATCHEFKRYKAKGNHNQLLIEPFLQKNAAIIQKIITPIIEA